MRNTDILKEAAKNTRRNKTRTALTVVAVFIGAFTLALTNSIGAGVSTYIDDQLGQIGADGAISVSKIDPDAGQRDTTIPAPFEETTASDQEAALAEATSSLGFSTGFLTDADIDAIRDTPGVDSVEVTIIAQPDWVAGPNGDKWTVMPNIAASVMEPDLVAGEPFTVESETHEIIIPQTYVKGFGYDSAEEAVGAEVVFGVTDVTKASQEVTATVVGVSNKSLFGESVSFNTSLSEALLEATKTGIPEGAEVENNYISAIVRVAPDATPEMIDELKALLAEQGYDAKTVQDQLGSITAVIDGIVGVLNGFAIIALIAAGFGIVNTLLMSVQERTREIGLMKAMGMPSSKVFGLFSTEAVIIGLMGTVLGVGAAWGIGSGINALLADTLLADLPGLSISLFTAPDVLTVFGIVLVISLLAGTIPSAQAAKKNPIDALRYE